MAPREHRTEDETTLVLRARAGDDDAFEALVNAYSRRIIGYCYKMGARAGAQDLAQEIFIKLYLALPGFDSSKPLTPFLFRIAHNHCIDALRRKRVPTVSLVRDDPDAAAGSEVDHPDCRPTPEELAQRTEIMEAVDQALASLPDAYRSALVLRHVEGLTYEEISETLGLPMGTVKARIHRGREKLQQKLRGLVVP
ncbi:MAG: sigma-70 family RNA polymerase sigma factor [Deltaproteobacteria bacterium]|nr:sigma-70 family RNA polymerase sigma factor [Deltaproteobacteria bacterium]